MKVYVSEKRETTYLERNKTHGGIRLLMGNDNTTVLKSGPCWLAEHIPLTSFLPKGNIVFKLE